MLLEMVEAPGGEAAKAASLSRALSGSQLFVSSTHLLESVILGLGCCSWHAVGCQIETPSPQITLLNAHTDRPLQPYFPTMQQLYTAHTSVQFARLHTPVRAAGFVCGARRRDVDESGPPSPTHLSHPPSSKAPHPMRRRRWADTAAAHDAAGRRLSTLQWHGPSHWNDRAVGGVDWPARVSGRVPKRGRVRVDWRGGLAAARRCVVGRVRARRGGAAGQGGAACPGTTWPVGVGLDVFQRWQGRAAASRAYLRRCGSGALPSRAVVGLRRRCDLGGGRVKVMQLLDHTGGSLPNSSQRRLCLGRRIWLELGAGQMRQVGVFES